MGIIGYMYSFFYEKKICEFCHKKYYVPKKKRLYQSVESHDTCSYNCSINLLSEYYNNLKK